jgi:hypothetical protein
MIYLIDKGPGQPTGHDRYAMLIQPADKPVSLGGQARVIWQGEDIARCREYINNLRELDRKRA